MMYALPKLPMAYNALEPYIDERTMNVHYNGHHKTYVDKLNAALEGYPDFQKPVEELLSSLDTLPPEIKTAVAHNAGGHANHSLFWTLLTPQSRRQPIGESLKAIENEYGSFNNFKTIFSKMAIEHFSNGWAWLCVDLQGKMSTCTTKDHESPITRGLTPLLLLDLWEHAYYLKYQNKRKDYVESFWNIISWSEVEIRWNEFKKLSDAHRELRLVG